MSAVEKSITLAETQVAGFGLANGDVVHTLEAMFDEGAPSILVQEVRAVHPDPLDDCDEIETSVVDELVVTPEDEIRERKIEIGSRYGCDRVIVETHDLAPRAFVRHERNEGGWQRQASWELHPATGITQTAEEVDRC